MYDSISISRHRISKNNTAVLVLDDLEVVHQGARPIDHVFADNVQKTIQEAGYEPIENGATTTFQRI